ncbi:hypothetical protein NFI96_028953 [Prochilodus magdalenae]|nr:hypothetical protein NFI96_028953 [Prochilodus magdalenae]
MLFLNIVLEYCLSVFFTTVDANSNLIELQGMLKKMEPVFEKYDALVYAPVPDIRKGCRQCETHPVANSTVFSQRMVEFIQKLLSSGAQGCGK